MFLLCNTEVPSARLTLYESRVRTLGTRLESPEQVVTVHYENDGNGGEAATVPHAEQATIDPHRLIGSVLVSKTVCRNSTGPFPREDSGCLLNAISRTWFGAPHYSGACVADAL